jgi:hypothetical protein
MCRQGSVAVLSHLTHQELRVVRDASFTALPSITRLKQSESTCSPITTQVSVPTTEGVMRVAGC